MGDMADRPAGLFGSLRRLGRSLVGTVRTRLDLVATEVEEQGLRLTQMLVLALAAAFCLVLALLLLIALVVVVFWDTHRLLALGGFTLFFAIAGVVLIVVLKNKAAERPRFLASTIAELDKDRRALGETP